MLLHNHNPFDPFPMNISVLSSKELIQFQELHITTAVVFFAYKHLWWFVLIQDLSTLQLAHASILKIDNSIYMNTLVAIC